MDDEKKISPTGESWGEYRKKHCTVEETAENDLMVKLVGEVINRHPVINHFETAGIYGKNACNRSAGTV